MRSSPPAPMRPDPYAHAPRLPEGERLDPHALLVAAPDEIEIEIGPGRGWFMVERLEAVQRLGMIGFEIKRKWVTVVDGRLQRRGLGDRGRVFAEDARQALPRLQRGSVAAVHVNFPDPWWKKRHQKRLVLTAELVAEVACVLQPRGELFVQTDVAERADVYERVIDGAGRFVPCEERARVDDHPYQARSPRERRAIDDGIPVFRLRYRLASGG